MSPRGDNPVTSRAQDSLNRTPLANALAQQIASTDADQEVVFGLVGSWGSGKTSLLNMANEALAEDFEDVMILRFNPWLFSGTEHLVSVFFEELAAQLLERPDERSKKVGQALQTYGRLLGEIRVVPAIGYWATLLGKGSEFVGNQLTKRSEQEPVSLIAQKRKLGEALAALDKKIVVMVDDLDRPRRQEEIRDMVALVRLNADLPNLVFVLAYDRRRVEEALKAAEGDGRAYLEKIVQVVHDVPKARDVDLTQALIAAINDVLEQASITGPYDEDRFKNVFHTVIRPLVGTIRDVRRYANPLPVTLEIIGDEIDLTDVLALEAIRVLLPDTFDALTEAYEALTTPSDKLGSTSRTASPQMEEARTRIERFVSSGGPHEEVTRQAQRRLFPASLWVENTDYDSFWLKSWSKERLVAHPRVLSFYLEKQLPEGVLPAREVQKLFEALGNREKLQALFDKMDPDTLEHALERLEDYEDDYLPEHVEVAVEVLSNQLPRLREGTETFGDFGADITLQRVILRLLRKVADQEELSRSVQMVLPRIAPLSGQLQLVEMIGYRPNTGEKLVSNEEATNLEEQLLTATERATPETLSRERYLIRLLFRARDIDPERGNTLVARLAEEDAIFLAALRNLYREVHTATVGDVTSRVQYELGWSALCSLFGEEVVERRVEELSRLVEPGTTENSLDEKTEAALRLAIQYSSGWRPE